MSALENTRSPLLTCYCRLRLTQAFMLFLSLSLAICRVLFKLFDVLCRGASLHFSSSDFCRGICRLECGRHFLLTSSLVVSIDKAASRNARASDRKLSSLPFSSLLFTEREVGVLCFFRSF